MLKYQISAMADAYVEYLGSEHSLATKAQSTKLDFHPMLRQQQPRLQISQRKLELELDVKIHEF